MGSICEALRDFVQIKSILVENRFSLALAKPNR
jgi:hypothetical protein